MTKTYCWIVLVIELLDQDKSITKLKAQEFLAQKYEGQEAQEAEPTKVTYLDLCELD